MVGLFSLMGKSLSRSKSRSSCTSDRLDHSQGSQDWTVDPLVERTSTSLLAIPRSEWRIAREAVPVSRVITLAPQRRLPREEPVSSRSSLPISPAGSLRMMRDRSEASNIESSGSMRSTRSVRQVQFADVSGKDLVSEDSSRSQFTDLSSQESTDVNVFCLTREGGGFEISC
mmetsp:Transcript_67032/g.160657  ORF Transcript_67032/g.160657 Transcript_67032/m.160657 type:complete len:172 (-) Transcript_67032:53-568(-)